MKNCTLLLLLLALALPPVVYASVGDLDRCSTTGENPVWGMVRDNSDKITEAEIASGKTDLPDDILTNAVIFGFKDLIYKLLKNRSLIQLHGGDALDAAASMGRIGITRILLENGISPNAKNQNGTTAIFNAVIYGCTDEVEFLVKHGADINHRPNDRIATLMMAAFAEGHYQTAAALLENGYKVTPTEIKKIKRIVIKRNDMNGMLVWIYLFSRPKPKGKNAR